MDGCSTDIFFPDGFSEDAAIPEVMRSEVMRSAVTGADACSNVTVA